jgi:hypothetical protein
LDFHINIADLKVNGITVTSGIFSGENYHYHWAAMSKTNTGLTLEGPSISNACLNVVYDPDFIDMPGAAAATKKQKQGVPE